MACPGASMHPLWGHDAFFPCFRFPPYFRKIFGLCGNFSKFYVFRKNVSIFIGQNFWWPHRSQISNFPPIFPVSLFQKNIISPLLWTISLTVFLIHLLFTYSMCISFTPYFDHDAFMHHLMHVLDAPGHVFILLSSIRVYFQPFAIGRMYRWLLLYVL